MANQLGKKYKLLWTFPLNLNRPSTFIWVSEKLCLCNLLLAPCLQHRGQHQHSLHENWRLGPQMPKLMYFQWRVNPIAPSRNSSSLEISLLEWTTTAIMEMLFNEMPNGQFFAWLYPGIFRALVHWFLQAVFCSWWMAFSSTNFPLPYIYIKPLGLLMPLISLHFLFSCILAHIPQPSLYLVLLFLPQTQQQQCTDPVLFTGAWKSWTPSSYGSVDMQSPSGSYEVKSRA